LDDLTQMAGDYFGVAVTIKISAIDGASPVAPPSLAEERKAKQSDRQRRLREDALAHPMVKKAVEVFEGTVEDVRPIDKGFV
ncbi:MAG TPA: DNA polymerase III subunit gamma/tau, partial [Desulfuromonadales bacterium]|nr:DNA polymerase III subunit gamma/tau [Desulfuromonadales bacterium]